MSSSRFIQLVNTRHEAVALAAALQLQVPPFYNTATTSPFIIGADAQATNQLQPDRTSYLISLTVLNYCKTPAT